MCVSARAMLLLSAALTWPVCPIITATEPPGLWLGPEAQQAEGPGNLHISTKGKAYSLPGDRARRRIAGVVADLLSAMDAPRAVPIRQAKAGLKNTGYDLKEHLGPDSHWLALEPSDKNAGAGRYYFRLGKLDKEIVLQAPHAVFDLHTGLIAGDFFGTLPVRAVFLADWFRYGKPGAKPFAGSPDDPAHHEDTLFHDLTRAWVAKCPGTLFIQIHSFLNNSVPDPAVDFVVSAGAQSGKSDQDDLDVLAAGLKRRYTPSRVKRYPADIQMLGGAANVQNRLIRRHDGRFLHIEMSGRFRSKLKNSAEERRKFGLAIYEGVK